LGSQLGGYFSSSMYKDLFMVNGCECYQERIQPGFIIHDIPADLNNIKQFLPADFRLKMLVIIGMSA
jgi:hypothetical protein